MRLRPILVSNQCTTRPLAGDVGAFVDDASATSNRLPAAASATRRTLTAVREHDDRGERQD